MTSSMAQVNVTLHMDQKLGDLPFSYETITQGNVGYYFQMTRMQYYVSDIRLIHDGGQVTMITDLYFLVDPAIDTDFSLGSFELSELEQISFSIGVDPAHNHLDPSTYPNSHPLAPQNPSMHWGWNPGYRFIAAEGVAGTDSNEVIHDFQIHTIGDVNYRTISLDPVDNVMGDQLVIHIEADYAAFMNGIDAAAGVISHSSSGPSQLLADNSRFVYSVAETTSTLDPVPVGLFELSPNPSDGEVLVKYDFSEVDYPLELLTYDITGLLIQTTTLASSQGTILLDYLTHPGMYMVTVMKGGQHVVTQKLLIR